MARVRIANSVLVHVDDEDVSLVLRYTWDVSDAGYVYRTLTTQRASMPILLHRDILGCTGDVQCDHISGDKLDNRRSNLRFATASENAANRRKSDGMTSRFKGVSFIKKSRKWKAQIHTGTKTRWLGSFSNELDAAFAYDEAAKAEWGSFARVNNASQN